MKRIITLTVLLSVFAISLFANNYNEVMKENIEKIYNAETAAELTDLANQFQRIANVEKEKWMPGYYAAYCFTSATIVSNINTDEKHKYLDLAQAEIDKALKVTSEESEVYALQALIYQLRITDMSKGYKYSKLSLEALTVAEKLNPENPRIYYLRGSNSFHTPKMFGGGKDKARPLLEKAAAIFEAQKTDNKLAPTWGSYHNNILLKKCK